MSANVTSTNPLVQAIISGTAPQAARMAAARGMLPLAQGELLEILVVLQGSDDEAVKQAAAETLNAQEAETLRDVAAADETSPAVLGYLAARADAGREAHEAVTLNDKTPDEAIALLAVATANGALLELISINQQRLIRAPAIIDAVLTNAARTLEAERRVREVRREFFEKERGAQQIAEELRARGEVAAAEFIEASESIGTEAFAVDDAWLIASHVEVSDDDIDDSWLPHELLEELYDESFEQRAANAERVVNETISEAGEAVVPERVSLIRRLMMINVKDRVKMGMKGDRETRSILIRDANRIVSAAVIHNPRIMDQEIEAISAMRTVSEEVLRLIALNRQWARSYPIIHNLVRNPRTPIGTVMQILPRIQAKDLQTLSQNRNVSETVRRQAQRLTQVRAGN
ncbi:MAG: hypothetical protein WKF74_12505 [Pyrinomonadaceae bacterium]